MGDPLSYLLMSLYGNTQSNFCGFPSIHLPLIWVQVWVARAAVSGGALLSPTTSAWEIKPLQHVLSTILRLRTMAPDLEVLILIPAGSRSASNRQKRRPTGVTSSAKKQRRYHEATQSDPFRHPTAPTNSVHRNYAQNRGQRAALVESNPNWEPVWFPASSLNQVFLVVWFIRISHVSAEDFSFSVSLKKKALLKLLLDFFFFCQLQSWWVRPTLWNQWAAWQTRIYNLNIYLGMNPFILPSGEKLLLLS